MRGGVMCHCQDAYALSPGLGKDTPLMKPGNALQSIHPHLRLSLGALY